MQTKFSAPRARLAISELEPRTAFDAAAAATADAASHTTANDTTSHTSSDTASHDDSAALAAALIPPAPAEPPPTQPPAAEPRHEVVFVDQDVRGLQQLIDSLKANQDGSRTLEIVVLDARRDGIAQIAEALAGRKDIGGIHLIGEGNAAELHLGRAFLTQDSLDTQYAGQLRSIGQSLAGDADLLVYGCNFGKGEAGRTAMETLARLTGADIAASIDRTGHASQNADWDLEASIGTIETHVAASAATERDWQGALSTYTVTNTSDSGAGSLRQAILDANGSAGTDTIDFSIAGAGPHTIDLLSALPALTDTVILDGTTEPGFAGTPLIELNGASAGAAADGLVLGAGSGGSTIRGLIINRFDGDGIEVASDGNTIAGTYIGVDATGLIDQGNNGAGINVVAALNTIIGGSTAGDANVISGNTGSGIWLDGAVSSTIQGNVIGSNATGAVTIGNGMDGISIANGSASNTIGGAAAGQGNTITGSGTGDGVSLKSTAGANNAIRGNAISVNAGLGIDLNDNGVTANDAGDADAGANNLQNYPALTRAYSNGISTTAGGTLNSTASTTFTVDFYATPSLDAARNGEGAIYLGSQTYTTNAAGTVSFTFTAAFAVTPGQFITATATSPSGSTSEFSLGVRVGGPDVVYVTSTTNTADGDTSSIAALYANAGADGVISLREAITAANNDAGVDTVAFDVAFTDANHVYYQDNGAAGFSAAVATTLADSQISNFDANYPAGMARSWYRFSPTASLPTITGQTIIDGSTQWGYIAGAPVIEINGASAGNTVGLQLNTDNSTIRGLVINGYTGAGTNAGIQVMAGADNNVISGNYLGTDVSGTVDLGNQEFGIWIQNAAGTTVGGTTLATRNVISGNNRSGIYVAAGSGTSITGNIIGLDVTGTTALGNTTAGIEAATATSLAIGGGTAAARNVISGNGAGILLTGTVGAAIRGNYIGTDITGTLDRGNTTDGIRLNSSATGNTIGGTAAGQGNVISGNNNDGILLSTASSNTILGNLIGTNAAGTADVGNTNQGIEIAANSDTNQIGGSAAGARNVISGNNANGILITGSSASGNIVQGNFIGTEISGAAGLGNGSSGVRITDSGSNTIGGTATGAGNTIAFNTGTGITVTSGGSGVNNTILGNAIGSNTGIGIDLGADGVTANDAADADSGANNLQNFPVITAAVNTGSNTVIAGTLNTKSSNTYRIEFFSSPTGDPSGNGEGLVYLGATTVTTNASGNASFTVTLAGVSVTPGHVITSTATYLTGGVTPASTSEFSAATAVITPPTVTVTTAADVNDGDTSSIAALLANRGADGEISLREAIIAANNTANTAGVADRIYFAIPTTDAGYNAGRGVFTLSLSANLPQLTESVVIDGTTQTTSIGDTNAGQLGAGGTVGIDGLALAQVDRPEIEIAGTGTATQGFVVNANNVTIRGLAIYGFDSADIEVANNRTGTLIERNIIGTAADSFTDPGAGVRSGQYHIRVSGGDQGTIQNNLIGFGGGTGISLATAADNWTVQGNEIRGNAAVTTTHDGIAVDGSAATIRGNLITGNLGAGVEFNTSGSGSLLENNTVTGNASGAGAEGWAVGVIAPAATVSITHNVITGNTGVGVGVTGVGGSADITQNNISGNTGIGIDLGVNGVTANDISDTDTGGNSRQNFPVLTAAGSSSGVTAVSGTINTTPGATIRIDFYSSPAADASGYGEGQVYLGSQTVTADAAGNVSFTATLAATVTPGHVLTATATADGNTSEFCAAVTVSNNTLGVMQGHYRLDEGSGTSTADSSGFGNTGTLTGTPVPQWQAGQYVNAVDFSGTNDSVGVADPANGALDFGTSDFTISMWVQNPAGSGANPVILGKEDIASGTCSGYEFVVTGPNQVAFVTWENGVSSGTGATATLPGDGLWHNITGRRLADRLEIYVDGALAGTQMAAADNVTNSRALSFGIDDSADPSTDYDGGLDDVRLYGRALTPAEIAQLAVGIPGVTITPVSGLTTTEAGGGASFDVVLDTPPTSDVTLTLSLSNPGEGSLSTTTLTFTTLNWNVAQTVTVTGSDDLVVDGSMSYSVVTATASSADAGYDGLNPADVTLTNTDDDTFSTITVDTTSDIADGNTSSISALLANKGADGMISLREALLAANNTANGSGGADLITFDIAAPLVGGAHTIDVQSALPQISQAVIIDGRTDGDYAGTPVIELNGAAVGAGVDGLRILAAANNSAIYALAINRFTQDAINADANNVIIQGNYLGTDVTGMIDLGNGDDGLDLDGDNAIIGGTLAAERNLISGNSGDGIMLSSTSTGSSVIGNYIGTDVTGAAAIGNSGNGIILFGGATTIGGTAAGQGNVISGNTTDGIRISGASAAGNTVRGNLIGTNAAGTAVVGNGANGINITSANNNAIGGTVAGSANTISGNGASGIALQGGSGNVVQGNRIGLDVTGSAVLGGNAGITIQGTSNTTIGGTAAGAGNVIGGHTSAGIILSGTATGSAIEGNFIGTDASETLNFANATGIHLHSGATGFRIGGTSAGAGNIIANSSLTSGIELAADAGASNAILGNTIYNSATLGIDIGADLVTSNDANDADTGANELQNYPVLATAVSTGGNTTITGTISSSSKTSYRIEFFASPLADGSGYGEARTYLGYVTVSTSGAGTASFNTTLTGISVPVGYAITATATVELGGGNYGATSEFAQCISAIATASLIVDTVSDVADGNTASIGALLASRGADGRISLREAITAANNTANSGSADRIYINILDPLVGGAHTIAVLAALPVITDAVYIDATTDADFAGTPIIELNGAGSGGAIGLQITAADTTIRGLAINRFTTGIQVDGNDAVIAGNYIGTDVTGSIDLGNTGTGIVLNGNTAAIGGSIGADRNVISGNDGSGIAVTGSANTIAGNYIGLDAAGSGTLGNGQYGILVSSANTIIGGVTAGERNVVSGNTVAGISISGAGATNTVVSGNYIGTTATGTAAAGNGIGVILTSAASNNTIGGLTVSARNIISGNSTIGIVIDGAGTTSNTISGNFIGAAADSTALGNGGDGIRIQAGASTNTVGGTVTGSGNTIANNGAAGISVMGGGATTNNSILGNAIYSNTGLGIDLDGDGVTANDAFDADAGSNTLQNYPILFDVNSNSGNTTINGSLSTGVSGVYRVEFFSSSSADPSGFGEGRVYIGSVDVTTDATGYTDILTVLTGISVTAGDIVSATATLLSGGVTPASTSEFSNGVTAVSGAVALIVDTVSDVADGDTSSISALFSNKGADGRVSLREAIIASNNSTNLAAGYDTIIFNIPGVGPQTIALLSALPPVTDALVIDGTSQPGYAAGAPQIILNGVSAGAGIDGITLDSGAAGSTVRGLVINGFSGSGIAINANNTIIDNNFIGTDETGTIDQGNIGNGITITSSGNTIWLNTISGNDAAGVELSGAGAVANSLIANVIGTTAAGTAALGNGSYGVWITGGAIGNAIGSTSPGDGNLISGNTLDGVRIDGIGTANASVVGNIIGLDITGTAIIGNGGDGVSVGGGSTNIQIGGTSAAARNIISGNLGGGVSINGTAATGIAVSGNYIGVDITGVTAAGNGGTGILVEGSLNSIGGSAAGAGNVVSANGAGGIVVTGDDNLVYANRIGTDATGIVAFGNTGAGILVSGTAQNNLIGDTAGTQGNIIANNTGSGIALSTTGEGNEISGNAIYANGGLGIDLDDDGVTSNDSAPDADTGANGRQNFALMQSARSNGIDQVTITAELTSEPDTFYRIEYYASTSLDPSSYGEGQRFLGATTVTTDSTGVVTVVATFTATVSGGEFITSTVTNIVTGNTSEFSASVQANDFAVTTTSDVADGDTSSIAALMANRGADGQISLREAIIAANNTAGTDTISILIGDPPIGGVHTIALTSALPVITDSVIINGAADDTFAGTPVIEINGAGAGAGSIGLNLTSTASGSTVRGLILNQFDGSAIVLDNSSNNVIAGNFLGTDGTGSIALGNNGSGLEIINGSSNNVIGGSDAADRNVISGNTASGIHISGVGTSGNVITGNYVGTDASASAALGNAMSGILIEAGASNNIIGGTVAGSGNVISGNMGDGVEIRDGGTAGNAVTGNLIGTDGAGTGAIGNAAAGVHIHLDATTSSVGGTFPGSGNVISNNGGAGVNVEDGASIGHAITGNTFSNNAGLAIDLGNDGVTANDVMDTDTGANDLQNAPVLTGVAVFSGSTTIAGTFDGLPSTTYRIEFFSSPTADPSGYGEGSVYLGSATITTDATGAATINVFLGGTAVTLGHAVTATATHLEGGTTPFSTSEFSAAFAATGNANAPVITSNGGGTSASVSISENTTAVTTVTATDADVPAQTLTYAISGGADAARFTIDPVTGVLTFIAAPDFEAPSDTGGDNVYDVQVTASDGLGGTDVQDIAITVTGANDSPTISVDGTLAAIAEDDPNPPGDTVTNLLSGSFSDADAGSSMSGIAITGNTTPLTEGRWQYSTDAGTTWFDVGVTGTTALTLDMAAMVRFLPATDFSGTPTALSVRALDNTYAGGFTAGAVRVTTDTSAPGGSSPISASLAGITITVNNANDAPSIVMASGAQTYFESGTGTAFDLATIVSDADSPDFDTGTLTASIPVNASVDDRITIENQGTGPGQVGVSGANVTYGGFVVGSYSGGTDGFTPLTITFNASASVAAVQAVSRAILFSNVSDTPSLLDRTVRMVVTDGDGGTSVNAQNIMHVSLVNDLTAISLDANNSSGGADDGNFAVSFTEGGAPVAVSDADPAVNDFGEGDFDTIGISLGGIADGASEIIRFGGLTFPYGVGQTQSAAFGGTTFTITFSTAANTFTITNQAGGAIPLADAAALIQSVTYENTSDNPGGGARTITFAAIEGGTLTTGTATSTITVLPVNDAPTLGANTLTINEGATVTLTPAMLSTADIDTAAAGLTYTASAITNGQFERASAPGVAITTFTQAEVNAGAIRFVHNGGEAAPAYTITVSDGALSDGPSAAAISFTNVNDAPAVTTNTLTITEGGTTVLTAAALSATDAESPAPSLVYTASSIVGGHLEYSSAPGVAITTFSQADINAGLVQFVHDGSETVPSYQLTASDGSTSSLVSTVAVTFTKINDAPVFTSFGGAASVNISRGENIVLAASLTASDADTPAQPLTFSIIGGADAALFSLDPLTGQLSFAASPNFEAPADAGGNNVYDVVVSVSDGNGGTATQTLAITITDSNEAPVFTSHGGAANVSLTQGENTTPADVLTATDADTPAQPLSFSIAGGADAALFSIDPVTGDLTFNAPPDFEAAGDAGGNNVYDIVVQVSDANGGTATQAFAITITDVNEMPGIITNTLSISEGGTVVLRPSDLASADPDQVPATLTYTPTAVTHGHFALASAPGAAIVSFTQAQLAAGQVVFAHDGGEAAPTYTLTISDGALTSGPSVAGISFTNVTDPVTDPVSGGTDGGPTPGTSDPGSGGNPIDVVDLPSDLENFPMITDDTLLEEPWTYTPSPQNPLPPGPLVGEKPLVDYPEIAPKNSEGSSEDGGVAAAAGEGEGAAMPDAGKTTENMDSSAANSGLPDITSRAPGTKLVIGMQHFNKQAFDNAVDQQFADMQSEMWNKSAPLARVATGTGVVLSIGYVAWFLRGGALASALMGTMPVWRSFDPLPVVMPRRNKTGAADATSDEERIFDRFSRRPADPTKQPEATRLESMQ